MLIYGGMHDIPQLILGLFVWCVIGVSPVYWSHGFPQLIHVSLPYISCSIGMCFWNSKTNVFEGNGPMFAGSNPGAVYHNFNAVDLFKLNPIGCLTQRLFWYGDTSYSGNTLIAQSLLAGRYNLQRLILSNRIIWAKIKWLQSGFPVGWYTFWITISKPDWKLNSAL